MKKISVILTLLLLIVSLSGCIELKNPFQTSGGGDSDIKKFTACDWVRSDHEETIRFNKDYTGVVISEELSDYFFTWTLDPKKDNEMIWTLDTHKAKVVGYNFVDDDTLVIDYETSVWAYEKVC